VTTNISWFDLIESINGCLSSPAPPFSVRLPLAMLGIYPTTIPGSLASVAVSLRPSMPCPEVILRGSQGRRGATGRKLKTHLPLPSSPPPRPASPHPPLSRADYCCCCCLVVKSACPAPVHVCNPSSQRLRYPRNEAVRSRPVCLATRERSRLITTPHQATATDYLCRLRDKNEPFDVTSAATGHMKKIQ